MDKILHDPKDPKLWELWYIPYYGSCRILSINRRTLEGTLNQRTTHKGNPVIEAYTWRLMGSYKWGYKSPNMDFFDICRVTLLQALLIHLL